MAHWNRVETVLNFPQRNSEKEQENNTILSGRIFNQLKREREKKIEKIAQFTVWEEKIVWQ